MNVNRKQVYLEFLLRAGLSVSMAFFLSCAKSGSDDLSTLAMLSPTSSASSCASFAWSLPAGIPTPAVPASNCQTAEKVALGRMLFYDKQLSGNGTQSCASCHRQEFAFTDRKSRAVGSTGQVHKRNAQHLSNVAYLTFLNWANSAVDNLELQAAAPLFLEFAPDHGTIVELGFPQNEIHDRFASHSLYNERFQAAFPGEADPYTEQNIRMALAAFQRTLMSFDSPYDRFTRGDSAALTAAQKRGLEVFNNEKGECFHCHGGFNFTDTTFHSGSTQVESAFHNNGFYSENDFANSLNQPGERGLLDLTGESTDEGRFRAPSLRNVGVTFPYLHDGSVDCTPPRNASEVLSEFNAAVDVTSCGADDDARARFMLMMIVEHYRSGAQHYPDRTADGNATGTSRTVHSQVDTANFPRAGVITQQDAQDLVEFLMSLTDDSFLTDPAHSNPLPADSRFGP